MVRYQGYVTDVLHGRMYLTKAYQLILALSLSQLVPAQNLVAHLDYGTFQGAYNADYNISYWQKIPYAAPPVGGNRYAIRGSPSRDWGLYVESE